MTARERIGLVANRILREPEDVRRTLLDVSQSFLEVTADLAAFPERLHGEIGDLREDVIAVQPRFASHHRTSVLFDDEGLGRRGYERARRIADRIVAVARECPVDA